MQKRNLIIAGVLLIGALVGGLLFLGSKSNNQAPNSSVTQERIQTLPASQIGLTLKPGADKQRVVMDVVNIDGIKSLDYEVSYTAKGDLPRGAIGEVAVSSGQPVRKEIYLGTCSDVCHPDTVTSDVKIVVKVTKTDGKVYQSEASTSLK